MKFSEYPYKRPNLEKIKSDVAVLLDKMENTENAAEFEKAVDEYIETVNS